MEEEGVECPHKLWHSDRGIFRAFPLLCVFVVRIAIPKEAVMTDREGPKRDCELTGSEPVVFVWIVGRCHRSSASSYWRRGLQAVGTLMNSVRDRTDTTLEDHPV